MDNIHFPYRSSRHLALLHVIAESGSWEKHGLRVEYDYHITSEDAHKAVAEGSIEFVGGNHLSPYAARSRGDRWVYVGQTQNVYPLKLIVREDSGIDSIEDLRGKVIKLNGEHPDPSWPHPSFSLWLLLKQHGLDTERGDVDVKQPKGGGKAGPSVQAVVDGEIDADFVTAPADLRARRLGLKVIDLDPLPMIEFSTLSTSQSFVERHPDIVEKFVKGVIEGTAFFKTHRAEAIDIMRTKYHDRGTLDEGEADQLYDELAPTLEAKPYPRMGALENCYTLAVKKDPAAAQVDPILFWDTQFVRRLDDAGFIDSLYDAAPAETSKAAR